MRIDINILFAILVLVNCILLGMKLADRRDEKLKKI
jgi:hypothetical protein